MTNIHPSALVDRTAELGADVEVGPFAFVGPGARIGDGSRLLPYASVRAGCELGRQVVVDSHAVVGGEPQVRGFDPATPSRVRVGDRCILREYVSIHRGSKPDGVTMVGADCYLMTATHVAHDCRVGDQVTMASGAMLGGHVEVGPHAFLGGNAGVHQFVRIGGGAIVGGNALMTLDVPPYTMASERNLVYGLNRVGLRRRGFAPEVLRDLKDCFRAVFYRHLGVRPAAEQALREGRIGTTAEGREFLQFCLGGLRGFVRARRGRTRPAGEDGD